MACPAQDITDTELLILQVLWNDGSLTTREITQRVYPKVSINHYATVQSLLARLEEKEIVERDRSKRAHVFTARVNRNEVIVRRLRTIAERFCEGSLSPLLTHLVQEKTLGSEERKALRALLDAYEGESKSGR